MIFAFYALVATAVIVPFLFMYSFWRDSKLRGWNWTTSESRGMYVDAAKTLITAAGIVVALVASSAFSSARTNNPLMTWSAKAAVLCLISSIFTAFVAILALVRSFERAQSRYVESGKPAGQGQLLDTELLFILVPSGCALSGFLVGLLFLGRMAYNF